jgi:hypothetical protein
VDISIETIRKRTSKKELFEFIVHAHTRREDRRAAATTEHATRD